MPPALTRRLAQRWIAASTGCDASLQPAEPPRRLT
jgi:hypothetical protein